MWRLILILLPAVIAPAALASEAPAGPPSVLVGREICRRLVAHRPAPDVLYRPGVNLRGRPVAPAVADFGAAGHPEAGSPGAARRAAGPL